MNSFQLTKFIFAALVIAGLVAFQGCEPATGNKEKVAKAPTFKELATELVEMRNRIRDGFATNNMEMAHGPLHEVGHVLEKIATAAATENLSADKMEIVRTAKEELFEAFGQGDLTLHGKEGKTYDEVKDSVDAALKQITDIAGVANGLNASQSNAELIGAGGDDLPSTDAGEVVEESNESSESSNDTEENTDDN